jgi:hypothetical protein
MAKFNERQPEKRRMTARQQMQLHQMPKRRAYLVAQKRLEVMSGYLDNMSAMLENSLQQLTRHHYSTNGLQWLFNTGIPTLQQKIQKEQDILKQHFQSEILPPKN